MQPTLSPPPLIDRLEWTRLGQDILAAAEQAAERHQQVLDAIAQRQDLAERRD